MFGIILRYNFSFLHHKTKFASLDEEWCPQMSTFIKVRFSPHDEDDERTLYN
jgi:hypothetical protein